MRGGMAATDWNEVTAIATGALAVLTFLLVIAAILAARYAKSDIETQLKTSAEDLRATREATQTAQAMAQRQIEASHRPLLIDVPRTPQRLCPARMLDRRCWRVDSRPARDRRATSQAPFVFVWGVRLGVRL
jgi:hypothetical protein